MENLVQSTQESSLNSTFDEAPTSQAASNEFPSSSNFPHVPVPYVEPSELSAELGIFRLVFNAKDGPARLRSAQSFGIHRPRMSSTPLEELKQMNLKEMGVDTHHKGRFLLCRTINPPSGGSCVMLGVEDPNGWAQLLSVHNFPGIVEVRDEELDILFPLHTVLAVREPVVQWASVGSGTHIRIHCPSDILYFEPDHPLLSGVEWSTGIKPSSIATDSPLQWKSVGDSHFKKKQFFAAAVAYSHSLHQDPKSVAVRLNRCIAHNRLSNYSMSLDDARVVLDTADVPDADRLKALYRSALAEYGNGRYEEAEFYYKKCLAIDPGLKDAEIGIKRCHARLQERDKGVYDWAQMLADSEQPRHKPDVADYIGPVKVVPMNDKGGGRGVIATANIKAGDLLVVSKPIAVAYPEEVHGQKPKELLIPRTVAKVAASDHYYREVFQLYAPPYFNNLKPPSPSADSTKTFHSTGNPMHLTQDIDVGRIEEIVDFNAFSLRKSSWMVDFDEKPTPANTIFPVALFGYPSFINHSCLGNARRTTFGDTMIIRSTQDITKGDEILISYAALDAPYKDRAITLSKYLGQCECALCLGDRAAGSNFETKSNLINSQLLTLQSNSFEPFRQLVRAVESMYPSSYPPYRVQAAIAHHRLAHRLQTAAFNSRIPLSIEHLYPESIQQEIMSLEALGIRVVDKEIDEPNSKKAIKLPIALDRVPYNSRTACMNCLMMIGMLLSLNAEWRAEMWFRTALWFEDKRLGGGIPLFRVRYGQVLKELGKPYLSLLKKIEKT